MSNTTDTMSRNAFFEHMIDMMNAAQSQSRRYPISENELKRAIEDGINMHDIVIRNANLSGLNFRGMRFENSILSYSSFTDADLGGVRFLNCEMEGCNFINADLGYANFEHSELASARFDNANLRAADFHRACLMGTTGVMTVTPVGHMGRMVYAYTRDGKIFIQAGCRNASPAAVRKAVREDYEQDSNGYAEYMDVINLLTKWGKRELARLAK